MDIHQNLHDIQPMKIKYFLRWLYLFNETIDDFYKGEKAELAKQKAQKISSIMQEKLYQENK